MPTREEMWNRLGRDVDVLVVGGGITGSGIARDAARRGLSVALVEMRDLAYGTSSRSSKLVHGGLRYLESYEFSLVFESVSERRILMDLAPHLVEPLGFLFPVYKESRKKLSVINAGMWLYDGLSLFRSPRMHRKLKPAEVAEEEPAVRNQGLKGAPLYYDCSTDDARLTLEVAMDAAQSGADVATWTRVTKFIRDERGRVSGVVARDERTGTEKEVRAGVVINATGPWTDRTRQLEGTGEAGALLRPTKGVHIVVDAAKLPINNAVVCFHPTDDRVLFAIPWGDRAYVGTTDTDYEGDPTEVNATSEDIDYLIEAANAYFPNHQIGRDDVIATWAGLRPLIAPDASDGGVSESQVSREHRIVVGEDGLITVAGGKLTTFRRMAAEVVDVAARMLQLTTGREAPLPDARGEKFPLPGAVGWPADDDHEKVAERVLATAGGRIEMEVARHLTNNYGMMALQIAGMCAAEPTLATPLVEGRPEILAQVDWAVTREMAATVSDVMTRRTQLFFRDVDQGLSAAPAVADRMAELLRWDEKTRDASLATYEEEVAVSRAWRG